MIDFDAHKNGVKQIVEHPRILEQSEDMATHILLGRKQIDFLKNAYPKNCPPKGEEDEYMMRLWGIEILPVDKENFFKLVKEIN